MIKDLSSILLLIILTQNLHSQINSSKKIYQYKNVYFFYSKYLTTTIEEDKLTLSIIKTRQKKITLTINHTSKRNSDWTIKKNKKNIKAERIHNKELYTIIFHDSKNEKYCRDIINDFHFINTSSTINDGYYQNTEMPYGDYLYVGDTIGYYYSKKDDAYLHAKYNKENNTIKITSKDDIFIIDCFNDTVIVKQSIYTYAYVKRIPNLIQNGSFEEIDICPNKMLFKPTDTISWQYGLKHWISPNHIGFLIKSNCNQTNNFFNAENNVNSKNNIVYGDNYMALIYYANNLKNYNYIEYPINNLKKGKKYILGFKYKLGNNSKFSAKHFYFAFADSLIKTELLLDREKNYYYGPIQYKKTDSLTVINSSEWIDYKTIFTADSSTKFLIFGNLNYLNSTNIFRNNYISAKRKETIFFIDEIFILEYKPEYLKYSGLQTNDSPLN